MESRIDLGDHDRDVVGGFALADPPLVLSIGGTGGTPPALSIGVAALRSQNENHL